MAIRNTACVAMAPTSIAALNRKVRSLVSKGAEPAQAVVQVASDAGLVVVQEHDESGTLYRTKRGRHVFGWTNGEYGFDNQIN